MKRLWPVALVIVAVLACLYLIDRAYQSSAALAKAQAAYDEFVRVTEADHAMSAERIEVLTESLGHMTKAAAAKDAEIAQYVEKIKTYRGELTVSNAEVAELRTEVQPVLDANPKVAELVASLDAGIVLRDALIAEQDTLITAQRERIRLGDERLIVQAQISDEWKRQYEGEHALRVAAEGMAANYRSALRGAKTWRTVALVAGAAAAASIITK